MEETTRVVDVDGIPTIKIESIISTHIEDENPEKEATKISQVTQGRNPRTEKTQKWN
jgi:hypothetical protein